MASRPSLLLSLPSYATSRVAALTRRPLRELLAQHGLALPHFAVLAALDENGPMVQQALVGRLGIDKSQIVKLVDHVEQRGLAHRSPHPGDRRRHQVAITAAGRCVVEQVAPAALDAQRKIMSALSPAEQSSLMEMLRRVIDASLGEEPANRHTPRHPT